MIATHLFKIKPVDQKLLNELQKRFNKKLEGEITNAIRYTNDSFNCEVYLVNILITKGFFKKYSFSKVGMIGSPGMKDCEREYFERIFDSDYYKDLNLCKLDEKEFGHLSVLILDEINEKVKYSLEWYRKKFNEDIEGDWE